MMKSGVEEILKDQDATFFHDGITMLEPRRTKYINVKDNYIKNTVKNLASPTFSE